VGFVLPFNYRQAFKVDIVSNPEAFGNGHERQMKSRLFRKTGLKISDWSMCFMSAEPD